MSLKTHSLNNMVPGDIIELLLDNPFEGMIFVDQKGIVQMINKPYADFLGLRQEDVLGRPVREVVPQSKIPEVLQNGQPHFGDIWEIKGQHVVVTRIPIVKDDRIVGVLGRSMFKDELALAKEFVGRVKSLEKELSYYRKELDSEHCAKYTVDQIIGSSPSMQKLKNKIVKVAKTTSTVLITGESGTGKELIAHAIHSSSNRKHRPLVRVNCTSIPQDLLESELFGYEEGSFTGARKGGKLGKFELAQGGTIFLDEIGDMNRNMQAKLLRVLQEKEVERIGGTRSLPLDVRVVAATNRNLEEMMKTHQFREDLYYRLNVVLLHTPPLRERKEDISTLTEHLVTKLNQKLGMRLEGISPETLEMFNEYNWPGNVRELENILEQAINLGDGNVLTGTDFPVLVKRLRRQSIYTEKIKPLASALEDAERDIIAAALQKTGNQKTEAARLLGIHRSVLYRKINKYNL